MKWLFSNAVKVLKSLIYRFFLILFGKMNFVWRNFAAMINFERFVLDNGLRVIVHEDKSTPMAVLDVMYDVGARDEEPRQNRFCPFI